MKKNFITLCILIFSSNIAGANYVPIPNELRQQYKTEIEQIIAKEYSNGTKRAKKEVNYAKKLYKKIIKQNLQANSIECINLDFSYDFIASVVLLPLYGEMVESTSKYIEIDPTIILSTDYWGGPANFIQPYLVQNNINTSKINKLTKFIDSQSLIIEKYIKNSDNYCHIYTNQYNKFIH